MNKLNENKEKSYIISAYTISITWFSSSNFSWRDSVEICLGVINNYVCLYKQTRPKYHNFLVTPQFDLKFRCILYLFLFKRFCLLLILEWFYFCYTYYYVYCLDIICYYFVYYFCTVLWSFKNILIRPKEKLSCKKTMKKI